MSYTASCNVARTYGRSYLKDALVAYSYVGLWITLSAGVIMYNKYVLSYFGFPFPVALTMVSALSPPFLALLLHLLHRIRRLLRLLLFDRRR